MATVYATWNPLDKSANIALSNGNLSAIKTAGSAHGVRATISKSSGKHYFEIFGNSEGAYRCVGVSTSADSLESHVGNTTVYGWGNVSDGQKLHNGPVFPYYSSSWGKPYVIGVAVDLDAGKIWTAINGVWVGDPVAGTGEMFSGIFGTVFPAISTTGPTYAITANFGASAFTYSVPSGYNAGVYSVTPPQEGEISDGTSATFAIDADIAAGRFISDYASVSSEFLDNMGELTEEISANFYAYDNLESFLSGIAANDLFETMGSQFNAELYEEATVHSPLTGTIYYELSIADGFASIDTNIQGIKYALSIADGWSSADTCLLAVWKIGNISDGFMVWDTAPVGWHKLVPDTFALADAPSTPLCLSIPDVLTLVDAQFNLWDGVHTIEESAVIRDSLVFAQYLKSIADTMDLADLPRLFLSLSISDWLDLYDAIPAKISLVALESMEATDESLWGWDKLLSDVFGAADAIGNVASFSRSISDALAVADAVSRNYLMRNALIDACALVDTAASSAKLFQSIVDPLDIQVVVVYTGEVYECWVLTTPRFHSSIYSGYDFNSYCTYGGKSYGANATGIYELTGDTDVGVSIKTGVILPKTDFTIPTAKRLAKAHVEVTGTGATLILEVENGTRKTFPIDQYNVVTGNRDVKGREWIVSITGFDTVDSLKLIPTVMTR